MRISRFYIEASLQPEQVIDLPAHLVNYIVNVLRLKKGAEIVLFNADNNIEGEFTAQLIDASKRHVSVCILGFTATKTEPLIAVHLYQGISKGDKMDFTIQKSIELGITSITPVFTQRSNAGKLDDKRLGKKILHWQGVAISACEQSGRTQLVKINQPITVKQITAQNKSISLILAPDAATSLKDLPQETPKNVNIFIGPEGGLNAEEIAWAKERGYLELRLGQRILRTETAGLAILSVMQFLWGDFS
ncbi:16S rRNA (uracil(1498)-N(3))-methyltransferase [sulfur-oxidizing endosymbiont of Gigantopelta aegis]|uniref:16S rRNA (uracil(1498)-N(3))-methyltransferase n=1 Tax=sulfur-oxidizing endosymbiont of Gigantopelta aegis TaxID=2794934 RepID=UPI0018DB2121|nr:16S rRNA (uracil(1498)-N(3))-methyltransferase [sulfur-oxidizing endosymbiont of Gigantopelta aegis]